MGLSGGAIAGIVIGSIAAVVLLGLLGEAGRRRGVAESSRRRCRQCPQPPASRCRSPKPSTAAPPAVFLHHGARQCTLLPTARLPAALRRSAVADVGAAQAAGRGGAHGGGRRVGQAAGRRRRAAALGQRQGRPLFLQSDAQLCKAVRHAAIPTICSCCRHLAVLHDLKIRPAMLLKYALICPCLFHTCPHSILARCHAP